MVRIVIFSILVSFLSFGIKAQAVLEPKHTINIEVGLPITVANKAFKWSMQGVVNASGYYQYRFPFNLAIGAGANFSLFNVNIYRVNPSVKGTFYNLGGFLKVGHEKFYSETFGTDFGIKIGYSQTTFKDTLLAKEHTDHMYSINSLNMTPMLGFKLMADEANSYTFTFGYTFCDFNFYPGRLGYTKQGLSDSDIKGSTQFFTIGFGYTHYIGRKAE